MILGEKVPAEIIETIREKLENNGDFRKIEDLAIKQRTQS